MMVVVLVLASLTHYRFDCHAQFASQPEIDIDNITLFERFEWLHQHQVITAMFKF